MRNRRAPSDRLLRLLTFIWAPRKILSATWLLLALAAPALAASTPDFTIEDDHPAIPAAVDAVLRDAVTDLGPSGEMWHCELIGSEIDLDGDGRTKDYAVTTADACGWGSAKGPVWLVRAGPDGYKLVLAYSGYSLSLGARKRNALREVYIGAATAAWIEESHWVFKGRRYVLARPVKLEYLGR